ncbi:MAG: cell volume regulation protein A [Bacteroidia bacterium]|jgi:cell volume regulation protein A
MTTAIIITLCTLLLVSYVFALTSAKTKIPSVLLLLILGWGIKQATVFFELQIPSLDPILPVLATIGLVLIVLEGSLELKLDRTKLGLVTKSFFGALFPILIISFVLAYAFHYFGGFGLRNCLINAIPFAIISSAIAIPSAANLRTEDKEFVIYESSLSDILGVLIFNFIAFNEVYNQETFGNFGLEILLILAISLVATIGLSMLLARINHHVKFVPIILIVVLLYTVLKIYHLPGLIFILLFGLFVGHLDKLKRFKWIEKLVTYNPEKEVEMFTVLTIEGTFLIRSLFFLVFGYLLEASELFNPSTALWALGMVAGVFAIRVVQLLLSRLPLKPLLFISPRGLITILLFLYITPEQSIDIVNKSLIIQVIVFTVLIMTFGMMFSGSKKEEDEEDLEPFDKPMTLADFEESTPDIQVPEA